jgi:hypothetical protein
MGPNDCGDAATVSDMRYLPIFVTYQTVIGCESGGLRYLSPTGRGFSHVLGRTSARHVTRLSAKIQASEARERPSGYKVILAGTVRHDVTWPHRNAVVAIVQVRVLPRGRSRGDAGQTFSDVAAAAGRCLWHRIGSPMRVGLS